MRGHHDYLGPIGGRRCGELTNEIEAGQIRHQVVDDEDVEEALAEQPPRLVSSAVVTTS